MSDEKVCGTCKHHDQGPRDEHGYATSVDDRGPKYRGYGNHPNGRCQCPTSRWMGIVTGWQGECDQFDPMPVPKHMAA